MPKGLKRALTISVIALFTYCLLGFLILPRIALTVINHELQSHAQVPARVERILFNPFELNLQLFGIHLGDAVALERLRVDLQWSSLWQGALHLGAVELDGPQVDVHFAKDATLNLANLFKPTENPQSDEPAGDPFPVRVDHLALKEGHLHFLDERQSQPIEFNYDSLELALDNLTTLPDGNAAATLHANAPDGGALDWEGNLSVVPLRSSGRLRLSGVVVPQFWPYVGDKLPLRLDQGTLDVDTRYEVDLSQGTELRLSDASLKLAPVTVSSADGRPLLRMTSLNVADTRFDLQQQQAVVGDVHVDQLESWAAREADGQLDWQKLFAHPASERTPAAAAAPAANPPDADTAMAPAESKPWQVIVKSASLAAAQLHLADKVPKEAVALDIGPLDLQVHDFDSLGQSPFQVALDTGIGKQGRVKAEGQVQLDPIHATAKLHVQDLDLRPAQAYLSPYVRLELRSGMLGGDLDVALDGVEPLALRVSGRAEVSQLHTLDTLKNRDFVRWQLLTVEGIDYRHGESLSIGSVALSQPYARFIINEDLSTNVSELLVPQPDSAPPSSPSRPMALHIGGITLRDGSANFADFSLRPSFATAIQQLNGHIGSFGNREPQAAKVEIKGNVDRYAPVNIEGSLDPFDPLRQLDIATRFQRVQLTTLTPYSGKFAGYRIRKGRLDLDLHYRIEGGQLNAQNKVVLDQLELGERVDSPDALDLPIRLAVALLKDTQGRISLELPVQGNLNDPQFDVMPIVWQTLRNLIVRATTAPFRFIAGLAQGGGGQGDLDHVDFTPGNAELDPQAQKNLDTLAAALKERPQLRLEIEGASERLADGPSLAQRRLEQEYQNVYYQMLQRRGDKVPREASQLAVPDDQKPALLEGIYRSRLKAQPPAEWSQLDAEARTTRMRQAMLDSWSGNEGLLRRLAQQRAASIRDYLVQRGGLSDQRVYLIDAHLDEGEANHSVPTPLHLDSQ